MPLAKVYTLLDAAYYYEIRVVDDKFNQIFEIEESEFLNILKTYNASLEIGSLRIDKKRLCC